MMSEKIIEIVSFGVIRVLEIENYPLLPDNKTLQFVFDLRLLPDPVQNGVKELGTDLRVIEYLLGFEMVKVILTSFEISIKIMVAEWKISDFPKLRLCFMCGGGIQRSVAVAEHFGKLLSEEGNVVKIMHIALEEVELLKKEVEDLKKSFTREVVKDLMKEVENLEEKL